MNFTKDTSNIIAAGAVAISVISVFYTNVQLRAMRAEVDEMSKAMKLLIANNEQYKLELRALQGEHMLKTEHKSMGVPASFASMMPPVAPAAASPVAPAAAPVAPAAAPSPRVELFTRAHSEPDDEDDAYDANEGIYRALRQQMNSNSEMI